MGIFRFKKFAVNDDRSTMKVGTDAVLLGAWCPVTGVKRILDIGTGCGVIALMLAQRTPDDVRIDAVEMQEQDARQAMDNVLASPWPSKVNVHTARIQDFESEPYDLIVCNPPFFTASLLPPDPRRASVRHDHQLSRKALLQAVNRLLAPHGTFAAIIPASDADAFMTDAAAEGIPVVSHTLFHTRKSKPAERSLLAAQRSGAPVQLNDLVLYGNDNRHTEAYRKLTADFYL